MKRRAALSPLTSALRLVLNECIDAGGTFLAIERETGILRQSLMKFARGDSSLRLDVADKLAVHFGLECKPAAGRKGK